MGRLGRIAANVALAAGAFAAAVALVEVGLRIYAWRYTPADAGLWVAAPEYGWHLRPGRKTYADQFGEYHTDVRITARGFRDVEHEYQKGQGVFRILVLGDSYIEALQVELAESFPRLLEERMNASQGARVEVISAGVSAWSTDNELLYFRAEGHRFHPDLVLLAFTSANDVRESYEPFNRMAWRPGHAKPAVSLDESGKCRFEAAGNRPAEPWWRGLRLAAFLEGGLDNVRTKPFARLAPAVAPAYPVPADMLVYAADYPPEVSEAWRVSNALVRALREEVEASGAAFAVMIVNGPWAHDPKRWAFMLWNYKPAIEEWDPHKPNRLLNAFLGDEGIPFVDLLTGFEAAKSSRKLFFDWDVHWTREGHRVAAEQAADFLTHRSLAPSRVAGVVGPDAPLPSHLPPP
jgi:hypothetical protein